MTVQQLRAPALVGHVEAARSAVDAAAQVPVGSLTDAELPQALSELAVLEAQAASLKLRVLAEAEVRRAGDEEAAAGTADWAARLTGSTRAVMAGGLRLAALLQSTYAATREAFAAGGINQAQATVIVDAAESIPARIRAKLTPEDLAEAEAELVGKAVQGMNARRLRQAGRRMLERLDRRFADEHESQSLEDEEDRAERETWLWLSDRGDGTYAGRFVIPEMHAELLRAALERMSAPRRWATLNGRLVSDPTVEDVGGSLGYTERLGAAFCELLEHLPDNGHAANGATLLVSVSLQHLRDQLGAAGLDSGTRISARQARRLACDAGIVPQVLGGPSEVLDQGRESRLHTKAQRRALKAGYDTCAAETCERPFAWCEIHHPHPWSEGGRTDLENAVPLCGWHHHRAHDSRYRVRRLPNGDVRFRRARDVKLFPRT